MAGIKCLNDAAGIGDRCEKRNNFGQINAAFLLKPGVQFDTASDFASDTVWNTKIVAKDIIPILDILEVEPSSTDALVYTAGTGEKVFLGDGIRGNILKVLYDLKSHQLLRNYSNKNWSIIVADRNKNIRGTSPDGTIVKGFSLGYFNVSMQGEPTGADNPALTMVEYQLRDTQEWDTEGVYISNPTFLPSQLAGVGTVVMTQVGTIATNEYVVDVAYVDDARLNGQNSGADSSYAITGADENNFSSLDGSSATVAILTATESTTVPGRYTVAHTAYTAGTSTFVATSDLKYESSALTLA